MADMDRAALVAKLREQIEALQRIVPADLEGDEAYYRNGEYVRLSDVLSLLTAEPTTDHAAGRALVQTWQAEDATAEPETATRITWDKEGNRVATTRLLTVEPERPTLDITCPECGIPITVVTCAEPERRAPEGQ